MLEIPAGLTLSLTLLTLTTFVGFLFAISFSKQANISKYATWVSVPVLLWIIFQSTLSLNRWYMDRSAAHLLFPYLFTSACILAILFVPRLREWALGLRIEILIGLQFIRLPMEGLLHWAAYHRQTPLALTFYGGSVELLVAAATPVVLYFYSKDKTKNRMWLFIWSYAGITSLSALWIRSLLCAPSTIQNWGYEIPNYLMVHFPGSWIVTVIIPVLLFAQIAALLQMKLLNRN
ncbi:MAG: hypothetical protein RL040_1461 [Bacteroidota bacterium]|jgi:hypothetical protein